MSDVPPIRIEDRDSTDETYLWNVDEHVGNRRADPDVDAIYSMQTDETFLVGLEEQHSFRITGEASALRLAGHSRYSDDPLTALAEYAARLIAHVNGNQGTGWMLVNEFTESEMPIVIEEVDIIRERGSKYSFDYQVVAHVGSGMMPIRALDPASVNPQTPAKIAGQEMHEIEQQMIAVSQELRTHTYAIHAVEENEIEARSGALRTFTIQGAIPGDEAYRQSFDEEITSRMGQNVMTTYESAFPGETVDVMIGSFDSTREAGRNQHGSYFLELFEGTTGSAEGPIV